eukprot:gene14235-15720_t
MAESNNYPSKCQTKDLLSAALGQSGLHFEQTEEEGIQDVFAALAASEDFLSDQPKQIAQNPLPQTKKEESGTFDNDLEELMSLLDYGIEKYTPSQLITNTEISTADTNASARPNNEHGEVGNVSNPILIADDPVDSLDDKPGPVVKLESFGSGQQMVKNSNSMPGSFLRSLRGEVGVSTFGSSLQKAIISKDQTDAEVDEDDVEEELGYADTFSEYMPAKVNIGKKHPDPVIETSSMASVPPPDVWYKLSLPEHVAGERLLSALQLEAVIYASQQHENLLPNGRRAGFLIGDGAGVGKGRTVAGIIYENYLLGRKRSIWLSVSNDLKFDAVRDLRDIGCNVAIHALNKFKYDEKITSKANGKVKKGVIFATYSSLIGETSGKARFKTRLSQLLHWCGDDYEGVIIFDECHKAKNLVPTGSGKPTKTGQTVVQLQNLLPKARVVYCSATGASEPRNMAYMNRLGLWGVGTPFNQFSDFISSVEKRGVGAMEMVAMDMKLRGMYIARQLSFSGTSFDIKEISLSQDFIDMYNESVKLWAELREKFEKASDLLCLDGTNRKTMWGQFWSAHQACTRFFKYLCIAAKVKKAVAIAKEAVDAGKCIVIGLQSTGEARTVEQLDEIGRELNDFVSTAKGVLSNLIEKHFPVSATSRNSFSDLFGGVNSPSRERKRKQNWRDPIRQKRRRDEGINSTMFDSDSESCLSMNSSKELESNSQEETSDVEEQENSSDSDSRSESDDDNWLKAISKEPKQKKTKKKQPSSNSNHSSNESNSMSVLDAAGFSGRQFSWARTLSGDSEAFKSNRTLKTKPASELSRQISQVSLSQISTNLPASEKCALMKNELLEKVDILASFLPPNTLDELIDELGGPDHVAEMTGRKNRILIKKDGSFSYESRCKDDVPLEFLNIAEKERFMAGEKLVAVISEAASSGISLQADRRAKNQRRRLHITLELPWSADKAIQQFGRTHRSNQVSAPEYLFLISELAGEQRFASVVAKRLESLGALTHGDRRATESRDLSRYNFDTKYGRSALEVVLKSLISTEKPLVSFPSSYEGNFLDDILEGLIGVGMISRGPQNSYNFSEKDYSKVARFLNRILGLSVACQNALFTYFTDTMNQIIKEAKRNGRFDEGILDLGSQGESVKKLDTKTFSCPSTSGTVITELLTVSVERGLSWERAYDININCTHPDEGFYISNQTRLGKSVAILVTRAPATSKKKLYCIYRANIGLQPRQEQLVDIKRKYKKISDAEAEPLWNDQYIFAEHSCTHAYWQGKCKKKLVGLDCEIGMRKRTCYVLSGSVLSVWTKLEGVFSVNPGASGKMQIMRLKLDDGTKIVGAMIPTNLVELLTRTLSTSNNGPNDILCFL